MSHPRICHNKVNCCMSALFFRLTVGKLALSLDFPRKSTDEKLASRWKDVLSVAGGELKLETSGKYTKIVLIVLVMLQTIEYVRVIQK